MKTYDYLIAGGGAAGLSLVCHLIDTTPNFKQSVLIIDKAKKTTNDRTWCFWEKGAGLFEPVVSHQWHELYYNSAKHQTKLDIRPYAYKMVQGIDFYQHCYEKIAQYPNVEFAYDTIESITDDGLVTGKNDAYQGKYVFNSARFEMPQQAQKHYFLQHFEGWYIRLKDQQFASSIPNFMDFRVDQQNDCRFVYLFPLSDTEGLVEYTVFSKALLPRDAYGKGIKDYLSETLGIGNYEVTHKEYGVIPMTNAKIPQKTSRKVINIGTAGGHTKASTGYTFTFIQRQCQLIAQNLAKGRYPLAGVSLRHPKFTLYDAVFLGVLNDDKYPAVQIFDDLFTKLKPHEFLSFLDESSSLLTDLKIMVSVDKPVFMRSMIQELGKSLGLSKPAKVAPLPVAK